MSHKTAGPVSAMHKIDIIPDVLARTEKWRGGRDVYADLDPRKTALVVIDMQNAWVVEGQPAYGAGIGDIVPNINRLAAAVRAGGGAVFWVKMTITRDTLAEWTVMREFLREPEVQQRWVDALSPGSFGFDLFDGLDVRDGDDIVVKKRYSALIQGASDLEARLRARGIDTIVVTGTATNTCCEATARDGMMLNFRTVVVSDANAARSDAEHSAALSNLLNMFADVRTTDEMVALLAARKDALVG